MQPLEALLATFVIMAIMLLVELRVVLLAEVERIRLVKAVQLLVTVRTARLVIMALEEFLAWDVLRENIATHLARSPAHRVRLAPTRRAQGLLHVRVAPLSISQ